MTSPPSCWLPGCTVDLVAQWQRRPSDTELSDHIAEAQAQRAAARAAAGLPAIPDFAPSPTPADSTVAVHACADHTITAALALQVHQVTCVGPVLALLPGCGCSPEPLPAPAPDPSAVLLSTGWLVPSQPDPAPGGTV